MKSGIFVEVDDLLLSEEVVGDADHDTVSIDSRGGVMDNRLRRAMVNFRSR
jgi:hypothetical protein